MTLRDIINKEFEVINEEQKNTKKVINIFYKLNINLIKPQKEETQDNSQNQQQPQQQEPAQQQPADQGQPQQTAPQPDMASQPQQPATQGSGISLSDNEINALASVQTEEETENNAMDIKDDNNYTLNFCGNPQCIGILDFMYKDSNIYLDRKYQRYLEYKNIVESKGRAS